MNRRRDPLQSLQAGCWFKLICGASFQDLPAVRNLALAYTLAGADCIDVAADPAVITAAREALQVATHLATQSGLQACQPGTSPWLMISLNDGEDPHFRKAALNPALCPESCPRPCEKACPAQAIVFSGCDEGASGVIEQRCYGCGRCLPVCPVQQITTYSYVYTPVAIAPLIVQTGIDAVEIHTQIGRLSSFQRLWQAIAPQLHRLKLISVSCPDGPGLTEYLWALYEAMSPLPCPLVWQSDGRPMSGDIGDGTTHAAVRLGQKVLAANLPGYVQLAGGTNRYTVPKLKALGLLPVSHSSHSLSTTTASQPSVIREDGGKQIAGIAYGSYARSLLAPILNKLETLALDYSQVSQEQASLFQFHSYNDKNARAPIHSNPSTHSGGSHLSPASLERAPDLLQAAVSLAHSLVSQLKPEGIVAVDN